MYTIQAKQGKKYTLKSIENLIEKENEFSKDKNQKTAFLRDKNYELALSYFNKLNYAIEGLIKERFKMNNFYQFTDNYVVELGHAVHNVRLIFKANQESNSITGQLNIFYKEYGDNGEIFKLSKKVKSVNQILKHSQSVFSAFQIAENREDGDAQDRVLKAITKAVKENKNFIKIN